MRINRMSGMAASGQRGFTLIELIIVIVILGILAVVAVPKYVNMKTQAEVAAADGVYGAAEGAAAINFAKGLLDISPHTVVSDGTTLLNAMDGTPEGWTANAATISDGTYTITVGTAEVKATSKAVLSKSW